MTLAADFSAIERTLWKNDADTYSAALLPSAVLVFPETGPIGRSTAVAAIRQENSEGRRWAEVSFEDVRAQPVADGVVLLIYRARARWNDDTAPVAVHCSTLYVRSGAEWRVAFHQQSDVAGG